MNGQLDTKAIVRIIESEGELRLDQKGLVLVTSDDGRFRLSAPAVRHFCAEAVGIDRHAPPEAVRGAIELLTDRAFDTRPYTGQTA